MKLFTSRKGSNNVPGWVYVVGVVALVWWAYSSGYLKGPDAQAAPAAPVPLNIVAANPIVTASVKFKVTDNGFQTATSPRVPVALYRESRFDSATGQNIVDGAVIQAIDKGDTSDTPNAQVYDFVGAYLGGKNLSSTEYAAPVRNYKLTSTQPIIEFSAYNVTAEAQWQTKVFDISADVATATELSVPDNTTTYDYNKNMTANDQKEFMWQLSNQGSDSVIPLKAFCLGHNSNNNTGVSYHSDFTVYNEQKLWRNQYDTPIPFVSGTWSNTGYMPAGLTNSTLDYFTKAKYLKCYQRDNVLVIPRLSTVQYSTIAKSSSLNPGLSADNTGDEIYGIFFDANNAQCNNPKWIGTPCKEKSDRQGMATDVWFTQDQAEDTNIGIHETITNPQGKQSGAVVEIG